MNQFVKYRKNAAECYEAARILSDHRKKAKMLAMAQSGSSLCLPVSQFAVLACVVAQLIRRLCV
jgi:hypothetical protein